MLDLSRRECPGGEGAGTLALIRYGLDIVATEPSSLVSETLKCSL
jgi:hypothetical protein